MKREKNILYLSAIIIFILQACNLPSSAPAQEPTIDPLIAAQQTITAAASQLPTATATFTFTPPPTLSPTIAQTNTPAFTATPSFAYLTLSEATNCRVGPGLAYLLIDTFVVGQTIEVIGKHPFDNYWYVRSPSNPSVYCWMWGAYATGSNLNNVPVVTPPPSPTPEPTANFTAEYVNSGACVGWWSRINLTNKGPVAFKSISMSIKDTVTNEVRNSFGDGFQDVGAGCVLPPKAPTLGPGDAYTVVTPSLSVDPAGHKVSVTVTLCTDTGQGGTCVSKVVEFTP